MYAIIRTGGKQYRVEEGRALSVERLPVEEGATVELRDVLLIADDGQVTVGTPVIEGARVLAQVEAHGRAKKIIVFKYKAKVRTRKKTGHRQAFSRLTVQEILRPGQEPKVAAKPKARRRKAEAAEETSAPEAQVEVPPAEAIAEAPAPKRRTRRAAPSVEAAAPKRRAPRATPGAEAAAPAPKRRAARTPAKPEGRASKPPAAPKTAEKPAPRRRIIRKKSKETE